MGVLRCSYIRYQASLYDPLQRASGRRWEREIAVSSLLLVIPVTQCSLPGPITTSNDFQAQGITCRRVCNR